MASSAMKPGILVALHELEPSSPFFKQGASLRVTGSCIFPDLLRGLYFIDHNELKYPGVNNGHPGLEIDSLIEVNDKLQAYSVETNTAIIADGGASLKIDTQHLSDISFRIGSIYQFIGELLIQTDNDAILQARVGRNVDGLDMNLYYQSMELRRQFEADIRKSRAA